MPAIDDLSFVTAPSGRPPLQRAIAQRFSALALYGHGAIPNLSPLCEQKRTSARETEIEPWLRSLPARQMVLDIIGDLLAVRRQLKQVFFDDRIVRLLGKFPICGGLAP
ncbi:hypothetical protein V1282_003937 [Nitrobacteraceae bacterium AZCC 2146]